MWAVSYYKFLLLTHKFSQFVHNNLKQAEFGGQIIKGNYFLSVHILQGIKHMLLITIQSLTNAEIHQNCLSTNQLKQDIPHVSSQKESAKDFFFLYFANAIQLQFISQELSQFPFCCCDKTEYPRPLREDRVYVGLMVSECWSLQ